MTTSLIDSGAALALPPGGDARWPVRAGIASAIDFCARSVAAMRHAPGEKPKQRSFRRN